MCSRGGCWKARKKLLPGAAASRRRRRSRPQLHKCDIFVNCLALGRVCILRCQMLGEVPVQAARSSTMHTHIVQQACWLCNRQPARRPMATLPHLQRQAWRRRRSGRRPETAWTPRRSKAQRSCSRCGSRKDIAVQLAHAVDGQGA